METSPEINELAAAMAKARLEFQAIERTRTVKVQTRGGGSYSFNYAPLDTILAATATALAKHGIDFHWCPRVDYSIEERHDRTEGTPILVPVATVTQTCILTHTSGQCRQSTITLRTEECTPQGLGSVLTYGRRYTYEHVVGVVSEDDDDGNHASGNQAQHAPRKTLPACPKCHKTASVIAGKAEHGGGLVCWKKREGCGHTWSDAEHPATVAQHPEPPDYAAAFAKAVAVELDAVHALWQSVPPEHRMAAAPFYLDSAALFGVEPLGEAWKNLDAASKKANTGLKDKLKANAASAEAEVEPQTSEPNF